MAGQMLRRWNTFYGAFDHVDDAIEAADPDQFSRHVFRRARGDLLGWLCSADDGRRASADSRQRHGESRDAEAGRAPVSTELAEMRAALRSTTSGASASGLASWRVGGLRPAASPRSHHHAHEEWRRSQGHTSHEEAAKAAASGGGCLRQP
ncbi:hypothetical protein ZWY2020_059225 [Hordeum vulgare]|nr:hypothetical protein ZWY2020_059225 [Hordeum vulgare]